MAAIYEIRADFDRDTIVVYQAYSDAIADAALKADRFVAPFSFQRMTWIKPSFLWLMHRSNWARKKNQQRILAVRIKRSGWEKALSLAVLTSFEPSVHHSAAQWRERFQEAKVHLQWDPEPSLRGASLPYFSIQVGLSRQVIDEFVAEWVVEIRDYTAATDKIRKQMLAGNEVQARRHLPPEKRYPLADRIGRSILITD